MGEKCPSRLQMLHHFKRVLYGGMGWMRLMAQRIQEQNVQIQQLIQRGRGNLAVIGQIGCRTEAKTVYLRLPVNDRNGLKHGAKQFQRTVERIHFYQRQASKLIVPVKNVAEHVADELGVMGPGIKRKTTGLVAKA